MADSAAYNLFHERMDALQPNWQKRIRSYIDHYKRMLAQDVFGGKPWGCKVNTRYVATQVMTYTDFMVSGLLPSYPWVYAEANEPFREVDQQATEEFNARLEDMNFYQKLRDWIRLSAMYGIGVAKLTWLGGHGLNMSLVNPANIGWDPKAENLRLDARFVIEKYDRLTSRQILALAEQGVFDMTAAKRVATLSQAGLSNTEELEYQRTNNQPSKLTGLDAPVTLYDMVEDGRIVTIHPEEEQGSVLRDRENPYGRIYYYDMACFPETFQVQGYAIPELLAGIDEEKNTHRRQRTDIRSLEANPMLAVRRSSGINIYQARSQPGRIWPVTQSGDVEPILMHDTGAPLLQEEMVLAQEGDELIGIHAHTRGARGEQMKATVANLLHQNVNIRLVSTMKGITDYPLRVFFADLVELTGLYENPRAVTMAEWESIRPVIRMKMLKVVPHIESYVGNQPMKAQALANLFPMFMQVTAPEGLGEIAKVILKLLDVPDAEKITRYIIGPPEQQGHGGGPLVGGQGRTSGKADQGPGVAMAGEGARAASPGQPASASRTPV